MQKVRKGKNWFSISGLNQQSYGLYILVKQSEHEISHNKEIYWETQELPQICTVILRIRIGKVALFAVYISGNFWVTQYIVQPPEDLWNIYPWLRELDMVDSAADEQFGGIGRSAIL